MTDPDQAVDFVERTRIDLLRAATVLRTAARASAGARTRAPTRATGSPASFVSVVVFALGLAPLQRARVLAARPEGVSMR